MLLETRDKVTVVDMFNHKSSMYMHLDPKTALINEHLLESKMASQLHNQIIRAKVELSVVEDGAFLKLGRLQVAIKQEDDPNG